MFGYKKVDYWDMGVGVRGKNLAPINDARFEAARAKAATLASKGGRPLNKMRWRAHTAVWAASHALTIEGDFVECGVEMGFLSHVVSAYHDLHAMGRMLFLFDTFEGIPVDKLPEGDRTRAAYVNRTAGYVDTFEIVKERFAQYPNTQLVRGFLPDTLMRTEIGRIAYLSIDLNIASTEMEVITLLWERLSSGAVVLIDDYAWAQHDDQRRAWDKFTAGKNRAVLAMPTGQGILIK